MSDYSNHPQHIQKLGELYDVFDAKQQEELASVQSVHTRERDLVQGAFRLLETVLNHQEERKAEIFDRGQELLDDLNRGLNGTPPPARDQ